MQALTESTSNPLRYFDQHTAGLIGAGGACTDPVEQETGWWCFRKIRVQATDDNDTVFGVWLIFGCESFIALTFVYVTKQVRPAEHWTRLLRPTPPPGNRRLG